MHLQRPAVLQQVQQQATGAASSGPPNPSALNNSQLTLSVLPSKTQPANSNNHLNMERQQNVRIQRLEIERDYLRRRQQEILLQVNFMNCKHINHCTHP